MSAPILESPPPMLSYETTTDSQSDARRLRWWILVGGVAYGTASCVSSLTSIITRFQRGGNPLAARWTSVDWQNFGQFAVSLCAYGLLAGASLLALRGTITRARSRVLLIVAITVMVAIAIFGWILFVVRMTGRIPMRPGYVVMYGTRTLSFLVWPLVMLWTLSDRASAYAPLIRRRLWWGVAALGLSVATSSFAMQSGSFRLLLSLYSISWRVVETFTSFAMFVALTVVAVVAACRGATRATGWLVGGLLLGILLLETLNLLQFYQTGARTLQDIKRMMVGEVLVMVMICMPIVIALLCGSGARTRGDVPDVPA